MDKNTARAIADGLTWSRVWSVLPITVLAWYELKWWVFGLYIAAALTDLLDGMFARRAAPPATQIDLDGNADVLFSVMTLVWLWMLVPGFMEKYWLPYLPILAIVQVYLSTAQLRIPGLRMPHFQFGRIMMAAFCFMLPLLLLFGDLPWLVHGIFILGTLAKLQVVHFVMTCNGAPPAERESA